MKGSRYEPGHRDGDWTFPPEEDEPVERNGPFTGLLASVGIYLLLGALGLLAVELWRRF